MLIKSLKDCREFIAGDHTILRELLNPDKDPVAHRYSLAHARLPVGQWSDLHILSTSEVYYILSGAGRVEINGEVRDVAVGDAVYIPPQSRQRILAIGPDELVFLCIVDPAWRAEDETVLT